MEATTAKRPKSTTSQVMSYCIIRSGKLKERAKEGEEEAVVELPPVSLMVMAETSATNVQDPSTHSQTLAAASSSPPPPPQASSYTDTQTPRAQPSSCLASDAQRSQPTSLKPTRSCQSTTTSSTTTYQHQKPRHGTKQVGGVKSPATSWGLLFAGLVLYLSLCDWTHRTSDLRWRREPAAPSWLDALLPASSKLARRALLVEAQYRPEWPSKSLQQEIFLLNLEDGYFGCQVNESQDFLQLFELSRLCDGQTQCYLGTDEMAQPLKCNNRDRCSTYQNSRGQMEQVNCLHGVCLDGLCYCNDGWGGKSCDVADENECKFRPCDVFAHCTNTMGSYYCSCFPGYDGDGMHCQDINECEIPSLAALCQDNSECCNLPGHFVCKCKPGYQQSGQTQSALSGAPSGNTSVTCTDIDECLDERSCGRGASCENLPGSYRCSCPPGFTGDPAVECIDMDECRNSPCGAGAQCTNMPGGYRCSCAPGFERNPLLPPQRFNTLQTTGNEQQVNSSLIACLDINECQRPGGQQPICGSGAQCVNTPGAHFCQCPSGYTGNPKVACLDIDECAAHACGPNSQCKNTAGGYQCDCKPGYSGNAYSAEGCQDEDECLAKGACGLNAQCFNTLGSHQCTCLSGYTGDARLGCTDIDECTTQNPCGPGAQCHNQPGGYRCACPDKYLARGSPELGCERAAVDIGCLHDADCTSNALCLNATCQCRAGFQPSGIECVDVDECSLLTGSAYLSALPGASSTKGLSKLSLAIQQQQLSATASNLTLNLCGPEASCVNLEGSYRCECRPGYEKVDDGSPTSKCRDTNECEGARPVCGPNNRCFNTDGGYRCACQDGFIPIDQDPANGCKSPCDGVNCGQHATCKPHGEEAACVCKPGFTFDPNNIKLGCVDINECDTNYGPAGLCGQRALCTNLPGSYRCHCPPGYSGDAERYCEDINECDRRFGVFGQCGELAVCNNTQGSFTCQCAPGYQGDPRVRCADVDECSAKFGPWGKCGQNAICTNTAGKYTCRCPPDHSGDPHQRCLPDRPACLATADCPAHQVCRSGRCHCPYPESPEGSAACRHPCDRTECGPHATCRLDAEQAPVCVCDAGYMAPGDGRSGCVDVNECIQGATLSGVTPLSGSTSVAAGVGVGANQSHPCGRNALCRNHPGAFDCICPDGFSGDPYTACLSDLAAVTTTTATPTTTTTSTTTTTTSQSTTTLGSSSTTAMSGNYQQEPRTTACADQVCPRGQLCLEGQCVRPDACRDHQDCRPHQACELANVQLGFQCLNVCDLHPCGPEARCSPLNHRPICSCNASAGYSGDPYNLSTGCQLLGGIKLPSDQQQQQQVVEGSHWSANHQQQPMPTMSLEMSGGNQNGSLEQRGQTIIGYDQPTRRPNQPLLAYELPPATTMGTITSGNKAQQPTLAPATNPPPTLGPSKQQQPSPGNLFGNKRRPPVPTTPNSQRIQEQQLGGLLDDLTNANKTPARPAGSCQSDQHCSGNLLCLNRQCGCPPNQKREGDYCYLQRINCTTSAQCRKREDCVQAPQQFYQQQQQQVNQQFQIDELASGLCVCPRGFKLTQNGMACIHRIECDESPCAPGALCMNKIGSYECICVSGTQGEPYTKGCEPINTGKTPSAPLLVGQQQQQQECQSNSDCPNDRECDLGATRRCVSPCHACGPRAICTAANHVAICLCPPRYTGSAIDLVYGCQEPPAPTTTTPTSTTTTMSTTTTPVAATTTAQQTTPAPLGTTAVGVPVTTLLPAMTTLAPASETTTPELVEFRTIPPSELFVMCLADGIQVEVQLGGFDGIIYVKGHSQDPKCRKLVMSSNAQEFVDFKVQFGHCDLIHRDGEAGFVLVIQKHPKLVTYRARAYHVKCVYNTGERTVTLGFNVSMITTSGTIANTGPPPTCLMSITALDGREVTSAEIGQDLLLRVDVQPDSIYGGFARSCEAKTMDDEGEYQYEVTDANGCATDPSIFSEWQYDQHRKSLVARFNAFKFPSSNNLRFQCNIRVCFGSCPATNCNGVDAYGKRRRRRAADQLPGSNSTTLGGDDGSEELADELVVTDAFKEGALREEVMVQSNAILTFDKKEASLAQQRAPQVEDIEFVCLPRLGLMMSILLATLLALLVLAIATSCWCFTKRRRQEKRQQAIGGPLPHPADFPNPLMRSSSASTLREPIYGP